MKKQGVPKVFRASDCTDWNGKIDKVQLDGEETKWFLAYNIDEGWVEVIKRRGETPVVNQAGNGYDTVRLHGKITVELKESVEA